MSIADKKYKKILQKILREGIWDKDGNVRPKYADGTPAHSLSIFGEQVKFEKGEMPIITSKHTPVKSSINEVVHAFFRLKTNRVSDFEDLGVGYWKKWQLKDRTIGKSYGSQLKRQQQVIYNKRIDEYNKVDQVDYILHELEHNPYSRRIMASYWNANEVNSKALQECAYTVQFNVRPSKDGSKLQLDMLLVQRSVDSLLGLPSNWAGYYALQCALANLFNYEVGVFTHQMGNVHLYDNQIDLAKKVIEAPEYKQPEIWVNPNVDNFYDYTVEDIIVKNYKHGEKIRSDVAI